jgi:hypothetical protein
MDHLKNLVDLADARTQRALQAKVDELRAQIRPLADTGDTWGCDVLHGKIDILERAMAIMANEE